MVQSSFSKLVGTNGSAIYVNLDNVRHIQSNVLGPTVTIFYIGGKETLLLTGDLATQFLTDLDSGTAGN